MTKKRVSMRKITEILRLRHDIGLSYRAISKTLNIGYGTVVEYLKKADKAGLTWPLPNNMDEHALSLLFFPSQKVSGQRRFVEPDYPTGHQELKRKGVTKHLLWQEYREQSPSDGYSYAQFCHRYQEWLGYQKRSMRQIHRAGEKLFVDYCGPTMDIINPDTGELRTAQVFVAVLGGTSNTKITVAN